LYYTNQTRSHCKNNLFFAPTDSLPIETHVPVITIIIQQKLDLKQRYNLKHTRCTKQKN